jgi:hypothetical protein
VVVKLIPLTRTCRPLDSSSVEPGVEAAPGMLMAARTAGLLAELSPGARTAGLLVEILAAMDRVAAVSAGTLAAGGRSLVVVARESACIADRDLDGSRTVAGGSSTEGASDLAGDRGGTSEPPGEREVVSDPGDACAMEVLLRTTISIDAYSRVSACP